MSRKSESSPAAEFLRELAAETGHLLIYWCIPLVCLAMAPIAFILARDAATWAIDVSAPGAWIEISVAAIVPALLALVVRLWRERRQAWTSHLIYGVVATGYLITALSVLSVAFVGFVVGELLADAWLTKDVRDGIRRLLDMATKLHIH